MAVSQLPFDTHVQRIADYLPGGRIFQAKNMPASNLRKLITGIAHELFTADGYVCDYQNDINPSLTTYFLDEWESALGIPDSCFSGTGSLNERRRDIVVKLASLGVQTADDFVALAALFGIAITVESGFSYAVFPMTFPIYLTTIEEARFTIFITFTVVGLDRFPLTFPILFGDNTLAVLECLFRKLKPANCQIVFTQV
jgi:uncharacterized protein YmfQ (DUF2313 family)